MRYVIRAGPVKKAFNRYVWIVDDLKENKVMGEYLIYPEAHKACEELNNEQKKLEYSDGCVNERFTIED